MSEKYHRFKKICNAAELDRIIFAGDPVFASDLGSVKARLAATGAVISGHFRLLSGKHSKYFLRFSWFASRSDNVVETARLLVQQLRERQIEVQAVLAPETAGVILAIEIAQELNRHREDDRTPVVRRLVAGRDLQGRPNGLLPGMGVKVGEKVLLVNDVITTGTGLSHLAQLVESAGGTPIGMAVLADRRSEESGDLEPGVPLIRLIRMTRDDIVDSAEDWPEDAWHGEPVPSSRLN